MKITRFVSILVAAFIIITISSLIYAFDQRTKAEMSLHEAYLNLKDVKKWQQIADSALYQAMIQKDSTMAHGERARVIKMKYDSLLKVCK